MADRLIPSRMRGRRLGAVHVLALGICALCAQMIFIRELMALLTGTEFAIGALMAGWLVWVGIGGLIGGRIVARGEPAGFSLYVRAGVAAAAMLPLTVVGIRVGRSILCDPPGTFPPFSTALVFAVLAMAPFGFVYGMLYNIGSMLWRDESGDLRRGISRVYVWEAAGSMGGAILFSLLLLRFLPQFAAASVIALIVAAVLLIPKPSEAGFRWKLSLVLLFAILGVFAAPRIDRWTTALMFPGYRVEASVSSRYAEIVAASREESLSFFSGGARLLTIPEPERTEETVHIPLLLHPEPRDVLLIGGSLGGGWQEVSKHPSVRRVDCVELDGELVRLAKVLGGGSATEEEGAVNGKVEVDLFEADGRHFLSSGGRTYDVVILSSPPPVNLQWNRYYTREFFEIARSALAERGLFALSHPSSENFLSREQLKVLGTVERTMAAVFDELTLLPGSTCHFVGGGFDTRPESLLVRLARRGIGTMYVSEEYLPFRFSPERVSSLRAGVQGAMGARLNTDAQPSLPYLELLLEGERLGSGMVNLIGWLEALPPFMSVALFGALLVAIFIVSRGGAAPRIAVLSVGLSAFLLQLAVMLSYQAHTGLLYHAIVMLTALFMGGAAIGAASTAKRSNPGKGDLRFVHGGFVILALALLASYRLPGGLAPMRVCGGWCFHLLAGLGGLLTGSYYPLVVRTAFRRVSAPPALFYAYDLFGAAIGGMIGGLVLFPLAGIAGIVALIVCIHLGASLLLVGKW